MKLINVPLTNDNNIWLNPLKIVALTWDEKDQTTLIFIHVGAFSHDNVAYETHLTPSSIMARIDEA